MINALDKWVLMDEKRRYIRRFVLNFFFHGLRFRVDTHSKVPSVRWDGEHRAKLMKISNRGKMKLAKFRTTQMLGQEMKWNEMEQKHYAFGTSFNLHFWCFFLVEWVSPWVPYSLNYVWFVHWGFDGIVAQNDKIWFKESNFKLKFYIDACLFCGWPAIIPCNI